MQAVFFAIFALKVRGLWFNIYVIIHIRVFIEPGAVLYGVGTLTPIVSSLLCVFATATLILRLAKKHYIDNFSYTRYYMCNTIIR